jgi:aminopeptidase N
LTDKADSIDIFIRAKVPFSSASNGVLEDVTYGSDYTTFHWKHRYPIVPYLVCFSVTNYLEYSQNIQSGGKSLAFTNYVYPEDSATAMSQTGAVVSMIQLFDSLFGPYPYQYEKYGQAQFGWGGGMEHQTITFLGGFGFELMAHELAHQWFGDKVTCGSWSDIWLNEGFATYLSGLVYEFIQPIYWKRFREVRVQSIVSEPDGSVFCDDTTRIERIFDGRLSYAKGGMILHQLRWILGDSVFFTALRNYIDDPDLAFGFVRNSDLKAHLESACLCNLTGYFNDWYTGQGYPSYTVNWKQTGNEVNLTLLQTQSHPSVSFFELPVPILLKSSTRDTILRLNNTFSGESFRINLPFSVDSVFVDPDYQLITANNVVYGIHESPGLPSSRVFPVPADDLVTIETSSFPPNANVSLILFSSLGTPVLNLPGRTTDNNIVLNISFLPPGIYFYSVTCGSDRIHGKIIIQH